MFQFCLSSSEAVVSRLRQHVCIHVSLQFQFISASCLQQSYM